MDFKRIPFLPRRFEVSPTGIVKTLAHETTFVTKRGKTITRHLPERYLPQRMRKLHADAPYPRPAVCVYLGSGRENNRTRCFYVSRLVACTHLDVPFDMSDSSQVMSWRVLHRDGDVTNCDATNLLWVPNAGQDGETFSCQMRYEQNLLGFEGSDSSAVLGRLFEESAA